MLNGEWRSASGPEAPAGRARVAAPRRHAWHDSGPAVSESRVRIERVITMVRVAFLAVAVLAVLARPEQGFTRDTYAILFGYAVFAAVVTLTARAAPWCLVGREALVHLLDVIWAACLVLQTGAIAFNVVVFFAFSMFAAAARWGVTATAVTGSVAMALIAGDVAFDAGRQGALSDQARAIVTSTLPLLAVSLVGLLASQERAMRADASAASRVLARISSDAPFAESVRSFLDECLDRLGASQAVLAVEVSSTQDAYVWRASRPKGERRARVLLAELVPSDKGLYLSPAPRQQRVWHVRRTRGSDLATRVLDAGPFESPTRVDGSPFARVLDAHHVSSIIIGDAVMRGEWCARLFVLAPDTAAPRDLYALRTLVTCVAPALHQKYLVRRVRSRAGGAARARLARELHDGLLQSLIGLEMDIDALRRQAQVAGSPPEARLRQLRDQLRQDIADVRDSMLDLRVTELSGTDVLRIIAVLVDRLRRESGLDVRLASAVSELDCTPRTAVHLAKIVQEALANVRKHSGASTVSVTILQNQHMGHLIVEDDGRGFGFEGSLTLEHLEATDLGPAVIKERVRAIGGRLTIESHRGEGARMDIEWPRTTHH